MLSLMAKTIAHPLRALAATAKILGFVAIAAGLFVAASIVAFSAQRRADAAAQRTRLAADRSLGDDLPFDRVRLLATHNSYRRAAGPLRLFYIGLVDSSWPPKLAYSHPPLTEQLDSGLRSFELDVRANSSGFELAHVPLVDDYSFLDPALRPWDAAAFDRLDAVIRSGLGKRLVEPDELRRGASSLAGTLLGRGWPRLGALRGRFIVILHKNEAYRAIYTAGRPSLQGRAMLDCAPPGSPDAAVDVLNDPVGDAGAIRTESAAGILVRTRADADLEHSAAMLDAALSSDARIVSTDFPPGHPMPDGYVGELPGGRTMDALAPRP